MNRILSILIACMASAPLQAQTVNIEQLNAAIDTVITFCVAEGRREKLVVEGDAQGGFALRRLGASAKGEAIVERETLSGIVSGLEEYVLNVQADQVSEARACMEKRLDRVLDVILGSKPKVQKGGISFKGFAIGATTVDSFLDANPKFIDHVRFSDFTLPHIGLDGSFKSIDLLYEPRDKPGDYIVKLLFDNRDVMFAFQALYEGDGKDCERNCDVYEAFFREWFRGEFGVHANPSRVVGEGWQKIPKAKLGGFSSRNPFEDRVPEPVLQCAVVQGGDYLRDKVSETKSGSHWARMRTRYISIVPAGVLGAWGSQGNCQPPPPSQHKCTASLVVVG